MLYEGITVTSGCIFSGEAILLLKTETLARIDGIHSQFVEVESHQEKKTATNFETKLVEKYHETKIALSKVSPVILVLLCKLRKKQAAKVTEKHKKQLDTQQDKRPRIDDIHSQRLKEFYYGRQEKENAIFKFLFDLMGKSETAPSFISLLETVLSPFSETASKEFVFALLSPFSVDMQVSPFELLEKQAANVTDMYLGYMEQLFTQRSKRARLAYVKQFEASYLKMLYEAYCIEDKTSVDTAMRRTICNSTEDEISVFVQTLPLCSTNVHDHFRALMKLADYKELNLIEMLLKFVSSDTLTKVLCSEFPSEMMSALASKVYEDLIKTLQSTPTTALGLTADETKQNHIEIMSVSFILKTIAFSQQEIKVPSDHQMIILSDKYYQLLSWLNSLHQSTVPYIPSYKKDWTSHIDYSILYMYDEERVALAIQHTSGSTEEVYPGIAINCTAISDASSISCLQDAANSNSKEMAALWLTLINNQSNPSGTSGGPSYFHQDSSNSSIYYESTLLDSDIDDSGMSVAIESDILSSVDRDVRVVRHKKMTDPSPAYRLQFYAQRYWRHEQIDSNETDFYVPTESSVIDADESESDYDIEHTNHTKQKSKINSLIQEYQNLTDYSSSEDSSHWSIFLRKDFK